MDKKLREEASMEKKKERERGSTKLKEEKRERSLTLKCLTRLSYIKVEKMHTHDLYLLLKCHTKLEGNLNFYQNFT